MAVKHSSNNDIYLYFLLIGVSKGKNVWLYVYEDTCIHMYVYIYFYQYTEYIYSDTVHFF